MNKVKGVNLGGWFVLERWMKQSLFEGIDSKDETGFVLNHPDAKVALETHWNTWITYKDFLWLKKQGITSVRIPIPWWLKNESPYFSPLKYIKRALNWAKKSGLSVMLDLHTAPGCQNGFDNGGIEGVIDWPKDIKNIKKTVKVLGFIAKTLLNHESIFALEVLNEPHYHIDLKLIQDFYLDAYHEIRKYSNKTIVFHDAFRPSDPSWIPFLSQKEFENIAFDMHLYHCFEERLAHGTVEIQIEEVIQKRLPLIASLNSVLPVFIGEWSLGIHYQGLKTPPGFDKIAFEKLLSALQLYAYNYATGYYFWSYKIEHEGQRHNWDFRKLIENGTMHL